MNKLLSRDKFRESVFERDNYKCVICKEDAKDAHHIIERRLFNDGGYYIDNGSSLCEKHHIMAETTLLSCNEIREKSNITTIILPEDFYDDLEYDKWGNIICSDGERLKGPLFYDESVQKILDKSIIFKKYVKYPRTYHLPNSCGTKDDKTLKDLKNFENKKVVVTLKMDGEQSNFYNDYYHARSINSGSHESRNWVKGLWSQISYLLDDNMRVCGENLYAKHSVKYVDLESYFYMYSIWIDNKCLSWNLTEEYSKILGLTLVPVIYEGIFDLDKIHQIYEKNHNQHEGYVVRLYDEFDYFNFKKSVAKYVSPEFRIKLNDSHGHWISKKIEKNLLITK